MKDIGSFTMGRGGCGTEFIFRKRNGVANQKVSFTLAVLLIKDECQPLVFPACKYIDHSLNVDLSLPVNMAFA